MSNNKFLVWLAAAVLVMAVFHKHIFFSHSRVLTVQKNDAPEQCSSSGFRYFGERQRSSVPELGHLGYCGAILTDNGYYLLPDDKYPLHLHTARYILDQTLEEGCRFTVRIVGYGPKFRQGARQRVPLRQTISRILDSHECT